MKYKLGLLQEPAQPPLDLKAIKTKRKHYHYELRQRIFATMDRRLICNKCGLVYHVRMPTSHKRNNEALRQHLFEYHSY